MEEKKSYGFVKVKCHECGNEQTVFGRCATKVQCSKCKVDLAHPTGGKAAIKGEILELL